MSSSSAYWSTSEGQTIIYVIVSLGITFVLAVALAVVGYWCYRRGKLSKVPEYFARRPVWALPPRVVPRPVLPSVQPPVPGQPAAPVPVTTTNDGNIHIHHHTEEDKKRPIMTKLKKKKIKSHRHHNEVVEEEEVVPSNPFMVPQMQPQTTITEAIPTVSATVPSGDVHQPVPTKHGKAAPVTQKPPISYPHYIPPHRKPFLPFSFDPHLATPVDNVLTNNLLRFATGSNGPVPRDTNLKSVLILNKIRRKTAIDEYVDDDEIDDEDDEDLRAANDFEAIGGDEIEVDSRGGRVIVDDNHDIHVYSNKNSDIQIPYKEIV